MLNKDGHEESPTPHALRRYRLASPQLGGGVILAQAPDVGVNEDSDPSGFQLSSYPQPSSLPRRDPRHHAAIIPGLCLKSCPTNTMGIIKHLFQDV